jgi:hypothetical protein
VLAPLGASAGLVLVGGLDVGALASGVDTVTPGVETVTPDVDALTSGVDRWISGVETLTPGSVTPTLGTVTPTPGSDTPTPGSDTGSDTPTPGSDRPAGDVASDDAAGDAIDDTAEETTPIRRGWAPWAAAQLPVSSAAPTPISDAPSAIPPRLHHLSARISHRGPWRLVQAIRACQSAIARADRASSRE